MTFIKTPGIFSARRCRVDRHRLRGSVFSAAIVVKSFVGFVGRHGFAPFAWYRIALGAVALALLA